LAPRTDPYAAEAMMTELRLERGEDAEVLIFDSPAESN
jgi:hypothetical protein